MNSQDLEYLDTYDLKNLNNRFVLVKRHDNGVYYYCEEGIFEHSTITDNASFADLFDSEKAAQKQCDKLNLKSEGALFQVEKASNHFVSNFGLSYGRNVFLDYELKLTNRPVSIQDLEKGKYNEIIIDIPQEKLDEMSKRLRGKEKYFKYFINEFAEKYSEKEKKQVYKYNDKIRYLNFALAQGLETEESYNNEMKKLKKEHIEKMKLLDEDFKISTENEVRQLKAIYKIIEYIESGTIRKLIDSCKTENDIKFKSLNGHIMGL